MICPHCNQNILYKERSGQNCSKCGREFAFEPKTHPLGLHDARFRKAITKLSDGDKLYFTSGQLQHFLSRKKIKNSFSATRGLLIFVSIVIVIAIIVAGFVTSSVALLFLAFFVAIAFAGVLSVFWKREGTLNLPQNEADFESSVCSRWRWVYKQLPPLLIAKHLSPQNSSLTNVRGILVCPETEVLACLAANQTAANLGLLLFSPYQSADKLDFVRQSRNLPIFVLHDASPEGCLLKEEFIATHLGNDRNRKIYDLGLRPQTSNKANLMRLRTEDRKGSLQNLSELTAEEIVWLQNGNYTPLLALRPAQLIKFVTRAVNRRLQHSAKIGEQQSDKNSEAQAVGFMTWLGR